MKHASTNTVKCARKAAGAKAPTNQKNAAATRNLIAVACAEAGALAWPWPCDFAAGTGGTGLAAAGGGAASLRGGGGQVTLPSLMTVGPRLATSSMLALMTPSLVLHSSSVSRKRLVE